MSCAGPSPEGAADMRDKAIRLCRDYLSGAWKSTPAKHIQVTTFSGGLSNLLYLCSLPPSVSPVGTEPTRVLLRLYGQVHDIGVAGVITQSVIFTLLSERCMGPRLYGVFPGGRLEEYIPARPLLTSELGDPSISFNIAERLAKVHGLQVPITKEPIWLGDTMKRWLKFIDENVKIEAVKEENRPNAEQLLGYSLHQEHEWLLQCISRCDSPVVFCHNDLQEGNILINDNAPLNEDKLIFIDFEFCSYNYRGFDLANHFCERCYDYTHREHPYFLVDMEKFPTREQQLSFIRTYLRNLPMDLAFRLSNEPEGHCARGSGSRVKQEEVVLREVVFFTLVSHFFWTLWSIVNATTSQIQFGYWEYAKARMESYITFKEDFQSRYPEFGDVQHDLCEGIRALPNGDILHTKGEILRKSGEA